MKENIEHSADDIRRRRKTNQRRRVCFVTGTRAEFGLMRSTLDAIRNHPKLELQIIATGTHLSARHGRTLKSIQADGWPVDFTVPWPAGDRARNARQTGRGMADIAVRLEQLQTDILLVVGDRVEAFAAAAAGHIAGKVVAHIHGGDRALGQVDDSLRHAITKLAHLHFPATAASRDRIIRLGEDPWRVHLVGSPGIDGITEQAEKLPRNAGATLSRYALLVLHPTGADEMIEHGRAKLVLDSIFKIGIHQLLIIFPNNDPGSEGIIRCWESHAGKAILHRDLPRSAFLRLMRDAAILIGNSSSGIIEAASFGTPVVDIGPRQMGREHSANLIHVPFSKRRIEEALKSIWQGGKPIRFSKKNVYGGEGAGRKIASVLGKISLEPALLSKLIAY